jgi:hypothetical protein
LLPSRSIWTVEPPNTLDYESFEKAFLNWLDQLDWTTVIDAVDSIEIKALEERIASLALGITRNQKEIDNTIDLLIDTPSKELKKRLLSAEANQEHNKAEKAALEKQLGVAQLKHRDLLSADVVYNRLATAKDIQTRAKLRQEIRRKVSRIEFAFKQEILIAASKDEVVYEDDDLSISRAGNPTMIKPGTGRTIARVKFVSGAERWIIFQKEGAVLLWMK